MGWCNATVDLCGWPDLDGTPIDQAGLAWQDFLTQHVIAHDGAGYTSGPSVGLPTFADGRPMFWTSKIQAWQAMTGRRLGTTKGYLESIPLTKPTTLREILTTFNVTFNSMDAKNAAGQLFVWDIDDAADPAVGTAVRERIELRELPAPQLDWPAIETEMWYVVGWDPEQDKPRTITLKIRNPATIEALKGDVRRRRDFPIKQLIYTSDDATAADSIGRKLLRMSAGPPTWQPLPLRIEGVDREIGDSVRVSHRSGLGPAGVGYLNRPMVVTGHTVNGKDVTLVALDVQQIMATSMNGFVATGGGGWGWSTWPVGA
jgi:hypothetical protein